jgi:cytosine deaminase
MANLYANVIQLDRASQLRECFRMLTDRSARLLNFKEYGFAVGHPADVVIIDAQAPEQAIAEISQPIAAFKAGKQTVLWDPPKLLRPRSLRHHEMGNLQRHDGQRTGSGARYERSPCPRADVH